MHLSSRWLATIGSIATLGAAGGALAVTGAAATASASTTHGTVHVWVVPSRTAVERIVLTGAIGDHGTATSIDKHGKVDKNGRYVKIKLTQGTFKVDAVRLNKAFNKIKPTADEATCSAWATGSGDVTLYDGTGAYAGIGGTIKMRASFAFLGAHYKSGPNKGECDFNANPLVQLQSTLVGSGTVTY